MASSKSSIFHHGGRAGAAVIAVLSCALAIVSCSSTATTSGRSKVAAKFSSLSQVALGTAPLPRIADVWNHWHEVLHRGAFGRLYQLGRVYRLRRQTRSMCILPMADGGGPALSEPCRGKPAAAHPTLRTLSRALDFVRCHSLLAPPPSA